MTTLTLAKLAEIEAAAAKADASYWNGLSRYLSDMSVDATATSRNLRMMTLVYPGTVAALCRDGRRYQWLRVNPTYLGWEYDYTPEFIDADVDDALRAVGLIEP